MPSYQKIKHLHVSQTQSHNNYENLDNSCNTNRPVCREMIGQRGPRGLRGSNGVLDVRVEINQLGRDINGPANDFLGTRLAMNGSGKRIVIGTTTGNSAVYEWNDITSRWIKLGDVFGDSVSMDESGDRILVGRPTSDGGAGSFSGSAVVYQWDGSTWNTFGMGFGGDVSEDHLGYSVSINACGDYVAMGAIQNSSNPGYVRIYHWDGSAWVLIAQPIPGDVDGEEFGASISINALGNRIAIGARRNTNSNGVDAGTTRIYELQSNQWVQLGSDINGVDQYDYSGWSVSMNAQGNRVAIGAPANNGSSVDHGSFWTGHVRVYEYQNGTWEQLGGDMIGTENYQLSGWSVAMNARGDQLVVGARGISGMSGRVRVYQWNEYKWIQLGMDINGAIDSYFGQSVAINYSGDLIAIGAPNADYGTYDNTGLVQTYRLSYRLKIPPYILYL